MTDIAIDAVFAVSGGGRGITAQCVIRLARRYRCKFILLGRSSIDGSEPAWASGVTDEADLKRQIIADFGARGEKPTPVKVQRALRVIHSRREIEGTLQAIRQGGGQAEYLSVDITDAAALRREIAQAAARLGAVTGILHGAGNLADKLIENKTVEDFESVYSAKVEGLKNLLDCIPPAQLSHLILFSSAAGFYGNAGQADYAMANEVLNKAAWLIGGRYPNCRVLSLNWGPWEAGMVTPELKQLFEERGVQVIPIEAGTQILLDEIESPHRDVQVLVGSPMRAGDGPLDAILRTHRIQRSIHLDANPFLPDHTIGDHAVLPAVSALAWIANTCEQLYPGYRFTGFEKYRVLKGIVFDETLAGQYVLDLKEIAKDSETGIAFEAMVWSNTPAGKPRYHYGAQINLSKRRSEPPLYSGFDLSQSQPTPGAAIYQDGTLFHGPAFQGIGQVLNWGERKLTLECQPVTVSDVAQGQFAVQAFDPFLADVLFQAIVVWARWSYQASSLPLEVQHGDYFGPAPAGEALYVSMDVQSASPTAVTADVHLHDSQGRIYLRLAGARVTLSEQLNELFARPVLLRGE